ncbi:MAG: PKD domain-containing protein [Methanosarcina sp.]
MAADYGDKIGTYRNVDAYSNGADAGTDNGNWQSVEYIKRFYRNAINIKTSSWPDNTSLYYENASDIGLVSYPNGGPMKPHSGDILIFGGERGHAAIVMEVGDNWVKIIEQNWDKDTAYANLTITENYIPQRENYPVQGWLRKSGFSGGPDDFGYKFEDSNVKGGLAYNWIDITSTGTKTLSDSDDYHADNIPLGFSFNFYGTDYNNVSITNNGIALANGSTDQWTNQPIGSSDPHNFIAPFWDDLVTLGDADAIYYQTIDEAPNRKLVIEWHENHHYRYDSPSGITFEAILFEGSNDILFQYKDVDFGTDNQINNGGEATVGIEGPNGKGLQYSFNEPILESEMAILFKFPDVNLCLSGKAPSTIERGNSMTYTLYYNNSGDTAAQNVVLEGILSNDVVFESASDDGIYDSATGTVRWDIGSLAPGADGSRTLTASVPEDLLVGTVLRNIANISTSNFETRYDDNEINVKTKVTGNFPPGVGVKPNPINWKTPTTFSYQSCDSATGVDIRIHTTDGNPDIVDSMAGGPPEWTYTTTLYPRHGSVIITYTIYGCETDPITFGLYIDPAGYIYDLETGERIVGASVWLQRPDGAEGWENVPTGEPIAVAQPDVNPQATDEDGMYMWDVLGGTYRVHVEAPGYEPADRVVVSVPPPVFDLNVGMVRIDALPAADAGGPYEGNTVAPLILDGSGSYDPDEARGDFIVSYEWDLDGDSIYGDATGEVINHTFSMPYSGEVGLRVTNNNGQSGTDRTTISIACMDLDANFDADENSDADADSGVYVVHRKTKDAEPCPANTTSGPTSNPGVIIADSVETVEPVETVELKANDTQLMKANGEWQSDTAVSSSFGGYFRDRFQIIYDLILYYIGEYL